LLRVLFILLYICIYSCLFDTFVQVYRPLPPAGNPIAVKINTISHIVSYHIISYISSNVAEQSAVSSVRALDGCPVPFLRDAGNCHSTDVKSQGRNFHLCAVCACTHRWFSPQQWALWPPAY